MHFIFLEVVSYYVYQLLFTRISSFFQPTKWIINLDTEFCSNAYYFFILNLSNSQNQAICCTLSFPERQNDFLLLQFHIDESSEGLPDTLDIGDVSESGSSSHCASLKQKNVPGAAEGSSESTDSQVVS